MSWFKDKTEKKDNYKSLFISLFLAKLWRSYGRAIRTQFFVCRKKNPAAKKISDNCYYP
jgi:hypothetical protein